jgi:hypothetical protein
MQAVDVLNSCHAPDPDLLNRLDSVAEKRFGHTLRDMHAKSNLTDMLRSNTEFTGNLAPGAPADTSGDLVASDAHRRRFRWHCVIEKFSDVPDECVPAIRIMVFSGDGGLRLCLKLGAVEENLNGTADVWPCLS